MKPKFQVNFEAAADVDIDQKLIDEQSFAGTKLLLALAGQFDLKACKSSKGNLYLDAATCATIYKKVMA